MVNNFQVWVEAARRLSRNGSIDTEHGVSMLSITRSSGKHNRLVLVIVACIALALPCAAAAQSWVWTTETVDVSGKGMSLAVDEGGSVHISYGGETGLKYGFRPAGVNSKWFTMTLGGGVNYTNLKIDRDGNPHLCSTYLSLPLRYGHFDGKKWDIQEIAPEDKMSVQAACAVAISPDGTPHLSWYRIPPDTLTYAHMRYAVLKGGVWMMHTLDFDMQTGKWHSMIIDPQGNPEISYDAFVKGLLKLARWDGKNWTIQIVDSRGSHGSVYSVGMGSSLKLDSRSHAHISYYTDTEIRHAWQEGTTWKIETVDNVTPTGSASDYRSSLVLDSAGMPHISYEDSGVLKHAYWDGKQWQVQVISSSGMSRSRFNFMTIDPKQDILYLAFRDPIDGLLKVAVGRRVQESQTAVGQSNSEKK